MPFSPTTRALPHSGYVDIPSFTSRLNWLFPLNMEMIREASGDASLSFNTLWIINMCMRIHTQGQPQTHSWAYRWQAVPPARDIQREKGSLICASSSFRASELGHSELCTNSLSSSSLKQWRDSCNSDTHSWKTKGEGVWLLLIDLLREWGSGLTRGESSVG